MNNASHFRKIVTFCVTIFLSVNCHASPSIYRTDVKLIRALEHMEWVGDSTLVVSTYASLSPYGHPTDFWNGKVIAIDMKQKRISTLTTAGFLMCANAKQNFLVVGEGSYAKMYNPIASAPDAQDPNNRYLYAWDPKTGTVKNRKRLEGDSDLNNYICKATIPEHRDEISASLMKRGIHYIDNKSFITPQNPNAFSAGTPLELIIGNSHAIPLNVKVSDLTLPVIYQSHNNSHILRMGAALIAEDGSLIQQIPTLVLRERSKRVDTVTLPNNIGGELTKLPNMGSNTNKTYPLSVSVLPAREGTVLIAPDFFTRGGGIYWKPDRGPVTKLFGTPVTPELKANFGNIELSPDGCHLVFRTDASKGSNLTAINLCE